MKGEGEDGAVFFEIFSFEIRADPFVLCCTCGGEEVDLDKRV